MLFNSLTFVFLFLPLTFFGFLVLGRRSGHRAAQLWLVCASLFFYGWWNPAFIPLLIFSIGANYGIGLVLLNADDTVPWRKHLLVAGIVLDIGLLSFFKYAGFLSSVVADTTGFAITLPSIVLPLAISFFTFQQIAFLVDAHRRQVGSTDLTEYALFVTFFPQLISGPIVHHSEMMPQFAEARSYRANMRNVQIGLSLFLLGLFKKTVLADNLALYVDPVFTRAAGEASIDFFTGWLGAFGFTLQIFFDFSAYSDMALGAARLFNITLPTNFLSPLKARSMVDLWRQWHATLTRFFRDYVFLPLGGNRKNRWRRYGIILFVMLLSGLWHGAGWNFILFGALNGTFLVVNYMWRAGRRRRRRHLPQGRLRNGFYWLLTLVAWTFGTTAFRASDLDSALRMFAAMVGAEGVALPRALLGLAEQLQLLSGSVLAAIAESYLSTIEFVFAAGWLVLGLAVALLLPSSLQWLAREQPSLDYGKYRMPTPAIALAWAPNRVNAIGLGILAFLSLYAILAAGTSQFVYFQF